MSRLIVAVLLGGILAWTSCAGTAAAAGWRWPVRGPLIERFRTGPNPFAAGQHRGIDIAAATRTPVRSACSGKVTFAGFAATGGRTVSVACGPLTASYLHLGSIAVRRGERLAAGGLLGAVGRSGRPRSAVAHLHFGVRWTGRRFAYVDPLALLADDRPPPVSAVPRAAPPGRPLLEPAPRPAPSPRPVRPRPVSRRSPLAPRPPAMPWPAWAGLGLLAAALPTRLGRLRRRRARAAAPPAASARLRARS